MASSDNLDNQKPLAEAIREVTRPIHKRLDRRIVSRIPNALPPNASDPSVYISGLLHITPIYATFESLWESIIHAKPTHTQDWKSSVFRAQHPLSDDPNTEPPLVTVDPPRSNVPEHLHRTLVRLYLPGLQRADSLKHDIQRLSGWSAVEVDTQLQEVASRGALKDFVELIHKSVENRPHVLISYAYILYMALFAGGRYIRSQLESADAEFWSRVPTVPIHPTMKTCRKPPVTLEKRPGRTADDARSPSGRNSGVSLEFFHFDTPSDGLDLKKEFKQRLRSEEASLTDAERRDVLREAGVIFEEMLSVVQQLDDLFPSGPTAKGAGAAGAGLRLAIPVDGEALQPDSVRDSVTVAKERAERNPAGDDYGGEEFDEGTPFFAGQEGDTDEGALGASKTMRFKTEVVGSATDGSSEKAGADGGTSEGTSEKMGADGSRRKSGEFALDGIEFRINEDGEREELSDHEKALMYDGIVTKVLVVLAVVLSLVSVFFIFMLGMSMVQRYSGKGILPSEPLDPSELDL